MKLVVLLSGGLDSTTVLALAKYCGHIPHALIVDYGQRHAIELEAADRVVRHYDVPRTHVAIDPTVFMGADSSQVGLKQAVPHGHYASENMKTTVVPNRNMLLLALAGALAESIGAEKIWYAAHAGDHPVYRDCRPEFAMAAGLALYLGTQTGVELEAPFIRLTKTEIARRAKQMRVPIELTYSCYEGKKTHCGLCGTCVERREALREAEVPDPTPYSCD